MMISLRGVSKYFPDTGVHALECADFGLREGEIHALVGENGAGKSTLMRILAGELNATAGIVERADGTGLVAQHPELAGGLRLWEAVILGAEPTRFGILQRKAALRSLEALNLRWGFGLNLDASTDTLSISQRQKAAILSLLFRNVRYLILDEVTAVLAPVETDRLFDLLRSLRDEGVGMALISHKLAETLAIADRVTVLRRGRTVDTVKASDTSAQALNSMIFPAPLRKSGAPGSPDAGNASPARDSQEDAATAAAGSGFGEVLLRVAGLEVEAEGYPHLRSVDLEVGRGEIVAVAGVRESGLGTLELALAGLLPAASGSIEINGKGVAGSAARFRALGGAYIPADRLGRGVAGRLSLDDNLNIHNHRRALSGPWRRLRFLDLELFKTWSRRLLGAARIDAPLSRPAGSLSGGTLQRLILARELAEEPSVLLASEPGWGLDVESQRALARQLRALAGRGAAILLLSTDLEELLSIADRVIVLHDGRVNARMALTGDGGEMAVPPETRMAFLGAAMTGGTV